MNVGAGVAPGSYSLVIEGHAAGMSRTVILGLSVQGAGGNVRLSGKVRTANAEIPLQASGVRNVETMTTTADTTPEARYVPGQLLVQYHEPAGQLSTQRALEYYQEARRLTTQAHGLRVLRAAPLGQPDLVELAHREDVEAAAARLQRDPRVRYAELNYYLYPVGLPNDTRLMDQWALAAAGVPVAWERENGSSNRVVVAVIDSGVDLTHDDLQARLLPGYDFCAQQRGACDPRNVDADPNTQDPHGTHVAGLIGAIGDNSRGVAGVAYGDAIRLLPIKVFNDEGGGGTTGPLEQGIRWAVGMDVGNGIPVNPYPAQVINLSLGAYFSSQSLQQAINDARARGALVIAATGNGGIDEIMMPAAADGVLSVGSINPSLVRSCFSNYGGSRDGPGRLDIVAPGGDGRAVGSLPPGKVSPSCNPTSATLLSTIPSNTYGNSAGTSMATPMVAGVAALIWSDDPSLSADQVRARILSSAYFDPSYMTPEQYGAGILRADRALGLPGPGDQLRVVALGPGGERSSQVTLDTKGGSSTYRIEGLTSGDHEITVGAVGSLYGGLELTLSGNPNQTAADIPVRYAP